MIRLLIVAEGLTEVGFVNQVLKPHLEALGQNALVVSAPNLRGYRTYAWLRKFLGKLLHSQSSELAVTTMVDLFRLPADFPDRDYSPDAIAFDRVRHLEERFADDIGDRRFFPYLQLHEFEALVLAGLPLLAEQHPNRRKDIHDLDSRLNREFASPEHVNRLRPPSYWLNDVVPEYNKTVDGVVITSRMGLTQLRKRCAHFGEWLDRLEKLACGAFRA